MLMAQLRDDGPLEAVCQFVPGTRKGQKTCSAPHVAVSRWRLGRALGQRLCQYCSRQRWVGTPFRTQKESDVKKALRVFADHVGVCPRQFRSAVRLQSAAFGSGGAASANRIGMSQGLSAETCT